MFRTGPGKCFIVTGQCRINQGLFDSFQRVLGLFNGSLDLTLSFLSRPLFLLPLFVIFPLFEALIFC